MRPADRHLPTATNGSPHRSDGANTGDNEMLRTLAMMGVAATVVLTSVSAGMAREDRSAGEHRRHYRAVQTAPSNSYVSPYGYYEGPNQPYPYGPYPDRPYGDPDRW
jgi:hypothetical protein